MGILSRYLVISLLFAGGARAQVEDTAGLFKPQTIKEANARIERIREEMRQHGLEKQIVVYTVDKVPEELAKNYDLVGQRKELFEAWAKARLAALPDFDGIHILICQNPKYIEITVTPTTSEKMFTSGSRGHQRQLHRRLVRNIQPDNPDQTLFQSAIAHMQRGSRADKGLLEGIDYIGVRLDWNRPIDQTRWYQGMAIMGGLLFAWLVLGLASSKLRKSTPPEAGVHESDDSGRSIGVLGGGIGAVSGQWLYDHVFTRPPDESTTAAEAIRTALQTSQEPVPPLAPPQPPPPDKEL